jgi:hypothetical protein
LIAVNEHRALCDFTIDESQKRLEAGHHEQRRGRINQVEIEMVTAFKHEIVGMRVLKCIGVSDRVPMAWMFTGMNYGN